MATASLRRAYVARLRLYHFGFLSRTNKKVAIKNPVQTSAHTSHVWPSGILPRVKRKMPIINGTTTRKIASLFILVPLRSSYFCLQQRGVCRKTQQDGKLPLGRIADAHRDDGKRYVVHADEKLTAFLELESAVRA